MIGQTTIELDVRVYGLREVQQAVAKLNSKQTYREAIHAWIKLMLEGGTRYAEQITHKYKGYLARSHMWEYSEANMWGRIYLNRRMVYATGGRIRYPAYYGVYEHNRGGTHAFYSRTYRESMPGLARRGMYVGIQKVKV